MKTYVIARVVTVLLLAALLAGVLPVAAQTSLATLLDAVNVNLCPGYLLAEPTADQVTDAGFVPPGATARSILVFDLSVVGRRDAMDVLRFESKAVVASKVASVPVYDLGSLPAPAPANGAAAPLYGWMVVYYDGTGSALCRSTAYPALASEQGVTPVSRHGLILQMFASTALAPASYQPAELCSFDAPQYCDAIFLGDAEAELIEGTEGDDMIQAAAGNDTVNARAGNDAVDAGSGDDSVDGGDGNDVIRGGEGNDVIRGGSGDDVIRGDAGNDSVEGEAGVDTVSGDAGVDTVNQ